MIQLFNSLTKKKETFTPIKDGEVLLYQCGPTVYWTQHIGNLRAMVMVDIVVRTLRYDSFDVKFVRNYTDVGHLVSDSDEGEDKMEKGVEREGLRPQEIAEKYIKIFEKDCRALNILEPLAKPKATEYIKQIQDMVGVLLEKNYAYQTELAIYFDVSRAHDYTRLSGQNLEENKEGAGHAEVSDLEKKNPQDFALWFFKKGKHKNALQTWPSSWGEGFPGWHIECSAMIKSLLGATIDIHIGGIEHVSVHHTNEIAQSESANEKPLANYWLHYEHLLVDNKKMAKSEGTGFSLDEIVEKNFDPLALRYFFLQAHYRSKQNFTWEALEAAKNGLKNLYSQIENLGGDRGEVNKKFQEVFLEKINDDFNSPQALAVLQEVLKSDIVNPDKLATVLDFDKVLGLKLGEIKKEDIPQEILNLAEKRKQAKEQKDFAKSDGIRDRIKKAGYEVDDTKDGARIKKK